MALVEKVGGVLDQVGPALGMVRFFLVVEREVVELDPAGEHGLANGLPLAEAHGLGGAALKELPVEAALAGPLLIGRVAPQSREEAVAVYVIGGLDPGQLGKGGHTVAEVPLVVVGASRLHGTGPPRDGGHPNTALGEIPLDPAVAAVGVEIVGLVASFLVRTVVGGEDDEGVLGHAQFGDQVEDLADIAVDVLDHGGEPFLRLGPILLGELAEVGHFHALIAGLVVGMGHVHGEIEEKGLLVLLPNEAESVLREEVGSVIYLLHRHPAARLRKLRVLPALPLRSHFVLQLFHLAVADEELGIEIVSVPHVDVAEEMVEAYVVGIGEIVGSADAPLAHAGCGVTRLLEDRGQGGLIRLDDDRLGGIATHHRASHVPTREQNAAGRGAYRATRVELSETHTLRRHLVETRRLKCLLTEATEIAVTEVVGQDQDDVRWSLLGFGQPGEEKEAQGKANGHRV